MLPPGARLVLRAEGDDEVLTYVTNDAADTFTVVHRGYSDPEAFEWAVRSISRHEGLPLIDETGDQVAITCPRCNRTSYHPEDVAQLWCGNCHAFHPIPKPEETTMDDQQPFAELVTEEPESSSKFLREAKAAFIMLAALILLGCSPAIVLGVWRWAL